MQGLTRRQLDCLDAIRRLSAPHGVSPSLEELRRELGAASKSTVRRWLVQLRDRGHIEFGYHRARSVVIIEDQVSPAHLHKLSSDTLRRTAAHIAGILAQREGGGRPDHRAGLSAHSRPGGISAAGGGVG